MLNFIPRAVLLVPSVILHLKAGFYKTYDYMLQVIERAVQAVYAGNMGGEFVDILGNLITGQLTQAYMQAWEDSGETEHTLPDYLQESLDDMLIKQRNFDYINQYYRDIVDARVDKTPVDPLLSRATMWASRYDDAYGQAALIIKVENGGNLKWVEGGTVKKCRKCKALNGIVASAKTWDELGVHPQGGPNAALASNGGSPDDGCGGWHCDCKLVPTDQRQSPNARQMIMDIVSS